VLDISNIAHHREEHPALIRNIKGMIDYLQYDYEIESIADNSLRGKIDDIKSYNWYLDNRIISQAPYADIKILIKTELYDCYFITNDRSMLYDHRDIIPSVKWFYDHRIEFDIKNGVPLLYYPK